MKMQIIGVKRIEGNAKESGNPFDICRIFCMVPIEVGGFGKVRIAGHGFEMAEMELDPAALGFFANLKFPVQVDLETNQKFFRGKFETIVTGLVAGPSIAAVPQAAAK